MIDSTLGTLRQLQTFPEQPPEEVFATFRNLASKDLETAAAALVVTTKEGSEESIVRMCGQVDMLLGLICGAMAGAVQQGGLKALIILGSALHEMGQELEQAQIAANSHPKAS